MRTSTKRHKVWVDLDGRVYNKLKIIAAAEHRTISSAARHLIAKSVEEIKQ